MQKWKAAVAKAKQDGKTPPREPRKALDPRASQNSPANLYHGMIAPIVGYALRGAIWYQGESNASSDKGVNYGTRLATLIRDWRTRWGQGDFAFGWAQLPNYMARTNNPGTPSAWALVREGMLQTLALPNTGMGINIDIGEEKDIHPKNKQDVGHRLALWALADIYKRGNASSGPLFARHEVRGSAVELAFRHTNGGLEARGGELKGFAVAGADKQWHWARARIEGDRVIVSAAEVKAPVAVRYAWADNPDCNLYNGAGLPASPFRTDDWP
jgi:sialate O-acetylesterase